MKSKRLRPGPNPIVVRQGSVAATIYTTANRIFRTHPETRQRELKSEHPQFTLVYWHGSKRVRQKFTTLEKARAETGTDRVEYIKARQKLHAWNARADLNLCVADFIAAAKRLPHGVTLKECVDFWLKRHPAGLPVKSRS